MKDRIAQCFDRGAKTYDAAAAVQVYIAEQLLQRLTLKPTKHILEIGCGTGLFSQKLLTLFPRVPMLLTDIAPAMVSACEQRFAGMPHVQVMKMDGECITTSKPIDLIASNMTLHWFTEIKSSFTKIINKLESGGQFVFAMLGENTFFEWRAICEKHGFSVPIPQLPAHRDLLASFPELQIETEVVPANYQTMHNFLNSLKQIGATATHANHLPLKLSELRQLMREYRNELTMSYEVIYGRFVKS